MTFELTPESAPGYLVRRGFAPLHTAIHAEELSGGVSATVIAVRIPATGRALVVKQALRQLRVHDEWFAKPERAETEVEAMRLCRTITPGAVPRVLDADAAEHILVIELLPADALNWQAEIGEGRAHVDAGRWAGATLGAWHAATSSREDVALSFDDFEAFEQQRLRPFHETVMERRPELATEIAPYVHELRSARSCLVHGDYSMKNMLVGPSGRWVVDFEVAHYGNPVFDIGFFLSFVVLSAVRWPALTEQLMSLSEEFLAGYVAAAGEGRAGDSASGTGHTACLVLARTDGKSPAQFIHAGLREQAREVGISLLRAPAGGLWAWT